MRLALDLPHCPPVLVVSEMVRSLRRGDSFEWAVRFFGGASGFAGQFVFSALLEGPLHPGRVLFYGRGRHQTPALDGLRQRGHHVAIAKTPLETISALVSEEFDLLILSKNLERGMVSDLVELLGDELPAVPYLRDPEKHLEFDPGMLSPSEPPGSTIQS